MPRRKGPVCPSTARTSPPKHPPPQRRNKKHALRVHPSTAPMLPGQRTSPLACNHSRVRWPPTPRLIRDKATPSSGIRPPEGHWPRARNTARRGDALASPAPVPAPVPGPIPNPVAAPVPTPPRQLVHGEGLSAEVRRSVPRWRLCIPRPCFPAATPYTAPFHLFS